MLFDSANQAVGQDYSRWNDVWLTLRGQYGARSTPQNPNDPESSVMYVCRADRRRWTYYRRAQCRQTKCGDGTGD